MLAASWKGRQDGMTGQRPRIPFPWIVRYARLDELPWRLTVRLVQALEDEAEKFAAGQQEAERAMKERADAPPPDQDPAARMEG